MGEDASTYPGPNDKEDDTDSADLKFPSEDVRMPKPSVMESVRVGQVTVTWGALGWVPCVLTEEFLDGTMPPPVETAIEDTVLLREDESEPVEHNRLSKLMTNFEQFLALYTETFNISRKAFAVLREGLVLINSLNELTDLPQDIGTLKRRMVAQLPLIPLCHKMIQLNQNKLPTMAPAEKAKADHQMQADTHWFEAGDEVNDTLFILPVTTRPMLREAAEANTAPSKNHLQSYTDDAGKNPGTTYPGYHNRPVAKGTS
ncbi:hypothetical protein GMDG_08559 [Pseudogymnoascus destructans 20631-21]|uniref:Uncharacterized protein n=1 Tax=Pseudogymnoascus destructans (strain ATCC MYA-4855 / 20631-21) TaxID=658429 RepID=L8G7B9_PSED2|nr:hypothetical protein GMDG_08559 [Pseudogymnoascus destructans 20631-21]